MRTLTLEPLTKAAFAPFGDVIETEGAKHWPINQGYAERFNDLAGLDAGPEGKIIASIFLGRPRPLPIDIAMLERHPLGSQAFMPLDGRDYLVVVGTEPAPEALRAFRARADQGVNYARGVWHHPLLVTGAEARFLVIDRAGPGNNLEEQSFAAVRLVL